MGPPFASLWRQRTQAFSTQLASLDLQADDDPVGVRDEVVAQAHHVRRAKIGRVGSLRRGRRHAGRHEHLPPVRSRHRAAAGLSSMTIFSSDIP